MSQYNNPSIVSNGLVFAYDQANPKSYKGPALKNFLTQIEPRGISDNGTTYRFFSGTEQVYIPEIGTLNSAYVDMYNDYNGGSNNCCPSPYGYGQGITVTGNTQYTYGILYKSYNRYTNPNWMYHYEYNGGTYITEYGVHMVAGYSGQETHLGDGWYWSRAVFTTNANCNLIYTGSWMYQYATWNRFYVAKVVLLEGNFLQLHPKYWPDVNTTRTSSENIKSLMDSTTTITANNLTYNSDSTFSFSGSNFITIGSLGTGFSNYTVEIWLKSDSVSNYRNPIDCNWLVFNGTYSNIGPRLEQNSSGNLVWVIGDTSGNYEVRTVIPSEMSVIPVHCATISKNGSTISSYYNGALVQSGSAAYTHPAYFNNVQIGRGFSTSAERWFVGKIYAVKIYNRGLTASEVQQNYNATKARYV